MRFVFLLHSWGGCHPSVWLDSCPNISPHFSAVFSCPAWSSSVPTLCYMARGGSWRSWRGLRLGSQVTDWGPVVVTEGGMLELDVRQQLLAGKAEARRLLSCLHYYYKTLQTLTLSSTTITRHSRHSHTAKFEYTVSRAILKIDVSAIAFWRKLHCPVGEKHQASKKIQDNSKDYQGISNDWGAYNTGIQTQRVWN